MPKDAGRRRVEHPFTRARTPSYLHTHACAHRHVQHGSICRNIKGKWSFSQAMLISLTAPKLCAQRFTGRVGPRNHRREVGSAALDAMFA